MIKKTYTNNSGYGYRIVKNKSPLKPQQQKPKELDWKEKFKNEFYEGDDYTSNKYENLVSFIEYEILPQQRTELLEEIKKLESLKEDKFFNHSNKTSEYFNRVSFYLNSLRKIIIKDITNLLNKKDE